MVTTDWGEPLGWHNFFGHIFRFLKVLGSQRSYLFPRREPFVRIRGGGHIGNCDPYSDPFEPMVVMQPKCTVDGADIVMVQQR